MECGHDSGSIMALPIRQNPAPGPKEKNSVKQQTLKRKKSEQGEKKEKKENKGKNKEKKPKKEEKENKGKKPKRKRDKEKEKDNKENKGKKPKRKPKKEEKGLANEKEKEIDVAQNEHNKEIKRVQEQLSKRVEIANTTGRPNVATSFLVAHNSQGSPNAVNQSDVINLSEEEIEALKMLKYKLKVTTFGATDKEDENTAGGKGEGQKAAMCWVRGVKASRIELVTKAEETSIPGEGSNKYLVIECVNVPGNPIIELNIRGDFCLIRGTISCSTEATQVLTMWKEVVQNASDKRSHFRESPDVFQVLPGGGFVAAWLTEGKWDYIMYAAMEKLAVLEVIPRVLNIEHTEDSHHITIDMLRVSDPQPRHYTSIEEVPERILELDEELKKGAHGLLWSIYKKVITSNPDVWNNAEKCQGYGEGWICSTDEAIYPLYSPDPTNPLASCGCGLGASDIFYKHELFRRISLNIWIDKKDFGRERVVSMTQERWVEYFARVKGVRTLVPFLLKEISEDWVCSPTKDAVGLMRLMESLMFGAVHRLHDNKFIVAMLETLDQMLPHGAILGSKKDSLIFKNVKVVHNAFLELIKCYKHFATKTTDTRLVNDLNLQLYPINHKDATALLQAEARRDNLDIDKTKFRAPDVISILQKRLKELMRTWSELYNKEKQPSQELQDTDAEMQTLLSCFEERVQAGDIGYFRDTPPSDERNEGGVIRESVVYLPNSNKYKFQIRPQNAKEFAHEISGVENTLFEKFVDEHFEWQPISPHKLIRCMENQNRELSKATKNLPEKKDDNENPKETAPKETAPKETAPKETKDDKETSSDLKARARDAMEINVVTTRAPHEASQTETQLAQSGQIVATGKIDYSRMHIGAPSNPKQEWFDNKGNQVPTLTFIDREGMWQLAEPGPVSYCEFRPDAVSSDIAWDARAHLTVGKGVVCLLTPCLMGCVDEAIIVKKDDKKRLEIEGIYQNALGQLVLLLGKSSEPQEITVLLSGPLLSTRSTSQLYALGGNIKRMVDEIHDTLFCEDGEGFSGKWCAERCAVFKRDYGQMFKNHHLVQIAIHIPDQASEHALLAAIPIDRIGLEQPIMIDLGPTLARNPDPCQVSGGPTGDALATMRFLTKHKNYFNEVHAWGLDPERIPELVEDAETYE